MISSLRVRLALGALVAITLSLVATGFILGGAFTNYVVERYRNEMGGIIDQLSAHVELKDHALVLTADLPDPRFALPASGRYWEVIPNKGEVRRSASLWDTVLDPEPYPDGFGFSRAEGPDGEPVLVLERTLAIKDAGEHYPFRVMAAFPESEFASGLADYHSTQRWMLALSAVVLTGAAVLQGAIGLQPLVRMRRHVSLVRQGQMQRLEEEGPSELRPLVAELNLLLSERETAVERARQRASDLAHGLKTPLTVLSQLADHLPPSERALALQQVDLVRQRADRQLQAARLGVEQMVSTNLASLAGKLILVLKPVTQARGIVWHLGIRAGLAVEADPADIAECLGNVFDNASKWARSEIAVEAEERADGRIEIRILDDGPGVAEEYFARILKRGGQAVSDERQDGFSEGSGLGLAISADIVQAYGGSITLSRARLGGLQVSLLFPAAPSIRPEPVH